MLVPYSQFPKCFDSLKYILKTGENAEGKIKSLILRKDCCF